MPQLGLRLIRGHQLHGGIGHSIGCRQQHGIGGMHVPTGDAVRLMAEQAGDGRLVIADIGAQTGEAVAQHMRRDVGWQITQLGDPQPHLAIADDRCLAGSTGEHHITDPGSGLNHGTGQFRQGTDRCTSLGTDQSCSSPRQIDLRPSQATSPSSPSGHDHQPCGGDGWLPDLLVSYL